MKLNLIETVETGGALNDDQYRIQAFYDIFQMQKEQPTSVTVVAPTTSITTDPNNTDDSCCLIMDDYNFDRPNLPVPEGDTVKKVLLTYNGIDYQSNQVFETLVYDSASTMATSSDLLGHANSNAWRYCPASFKECVETVWDPLCSTDGTITSSNPPGTSIVSSWPEDTCSAPYDLTHGIVVKKFLTGEANITNEYYVRYSAPEWYDVYPSNVRGGLVYADGWYSGYYYNIFKWGATSIPAYTTGMIVWHNDKFWKSVSGSGIEPGTTTDWLEVTNLQEWIDFAIMLQNDTTNDLGFYLMNQYLVTCDINTAILNEVMQMANTTPLDFGANCIAAWVKLTQKKAGAVANFYNENFKDAQRILEQTRDLLTTAENQGPYIPGQNSIPGI